MQDEEFLPTAEASVRSPTPSNSSSSTSKEMFFHVEEEPKSNIALHDSILKKFECLPDKEARWLRGILRRAMCDFLDSDSDRADSDWLLLNH